jgi:type IX secretion system PorP/SprF family membrane protein
MKKTLNLVLIVLSTLTVKAQQDPQFSQYMFNNFFLNPAYAGVEGVTKLTAIHRSQWLGYQSSFGDGGAPTTQIFSMNTPIYKINSGFGAYIINDNLGPQNNLEIQASYAYHYQLKDAKISLGIRTGIYSQSLNFDQYRAINPDDPLLINKNGRESQVRPDFSAGLFYKHEKYFAGVSFNHLSKAEFDFGVSDSRNALQNHMVITGGYYYDLSFDLQLMPTALIKSDFNTYSFDLSVVAFYKDTMWGGLSFRQSDAFIILLGYTLLKDKSLRFGYGFDYIVKGQNAKQPTSHEFMLNYELPVSAGVGKKVVRTPRFRH